MNQYDNYKTIDIEWLGDIPASWNLKRVGSIALVIDPQPDHRAPEIVENGYPYLGIRDINDDGSVNCLTARKVALEAVIKQETSFSVHDGDIVFCKVGTLGEPKHLIKPLTRFAISATLVVIKAQGETVSKFLKYALESDNIYHQINSVVTGSTRPALGIQQIRRFIIPFPAPIEQAAIASYLDDKTAKIDLLIDQKQRMIDLLREERLALVNEVVTKGITPRVLMKDSGIEGVGEIPAHWETKRLKHVAYVRSGFALNGAMGGENSAKLPYLRVANVQDGYLKLDDITEVEINKDLAHRFLLKPGDLLMNEGGDNDKLGRGCVWQGEINPCLHQNHVFAVRMKEGINPDWVNALTLGSYARHYFMIHCKQSTNLASISQTSIKELPVLIPPIAEQIDILAYMKAETTKIDYTIGNIEREVELMQEYRTALISEVVTGKVCVTHNENIRT